MSSLFVLSDRGERREAAPGTWRRTCARAEAVAVIEEEGGMGASGEGLRHCYACGEWLPLERFWGSKRICRECQSRDYRKPETLLGVKVVHNPPPKLSGKCVIALCTMAGVIAGLCWVHDRQFRGLVELTAGENGGDQ